MEEAISQFHTQFSFSPTVENAEKLPKSGKYIVCGMGGSHLAAGLVKVYKPELDLLIHRDYGLPRVPEYFLRESLIIASSYSGNTEETLDAYSAAKKAGLHVAVVSTGGKLLAQAKEDGNPYVEMPRTGIQPRSAIGLNLIALMKLFGESEAQASLQALTDTLDPASYEKAGTQLGAALVDKLPAIYAATINLPLAYNWKIRFNETAKIPAFCNVLPELNHNEMTGFYRSESTKELSNRFHFVFLRDKADHPRIHERMNVLKKLYVDRGMSVDILDLAGENVWHKLFGSILTADWVSLSLAKHYGVDPQAVPMVEEFKKLLA
jgi:glucose/mannose-6-phosphate isomerase